MVSPKHDVPQGAPRNDAPDGASNHRTRRSLLLAVVISAIAQGSFTATVAVSGNVLVGVVAGVALMLSGLLLIVAAARQSIGE